MDTCLDTLVADRAAIAAPPVVRVGVFRLYREGDLASRKTCPTRTITVGVSTALVAVYR